MVGKTLELDTMILNEDTLACRISERFLEWESFRRVKENQWREIQEYIFATDTTYTSNSKLPWSNKTTIPKLCQIRDNLHANYMAALFPKRKWLKWMADSEKDNDKNKTHMIESYMSWCLDQRHFYNTASQLIYDYIDYGNVFVTPEWVDKTNRTDTKDQSGFNGPRPRRISPVDIVFDPTGADFDVAPKIIRSLVNMGEVKDMLMQSSKTDEDKKTAEALYAYLRDIRMQVQHHTGDWSVKNRIYQVAGFGNFWDYLKGDIVEVLTFYGSIYDTHADKYYKNVVIKVVDRHKIIYNQPNDSSFGYAPIFHVGWRLRPDILWAMGPLDNLVGMQYRIDHLENMKADCFDLTAYPPLKIKGYVQDFNWGPMERIYVGDDGDVEMMSPNINALNANTEIASLQMQMEEMAGAPKEAMGFRTPGEKTKYEIQSMENAASRVFTSKTSAIERDLFEPLYNAMLDMARSNMAETTIRIFDDEFKINDFMTLTRHDITGSGRIKPIAARHFAEQSQMVQNLTNFMSSSLGQDPSVMQHFSSVKIAQLMEDLLEIDSYGIVQPYVRLDEMTTQQKLMNALQEQTLVENGTPTGFQPGDSDEGFEEAPAGLDQGPPV